MFSTTQRENVERHPALEQRPKLLKTADTIVGFSGVFLISVRAYSVRLGSVQLSRKQRILLLNFSADVSSFVLTLYRCIQRLKIRKINTLVGNE